MKKQISNIVFLIGILFNSLLITSCINNETSLLELETRYFKTEINIKAYFSNYIDKNTRKNYLYKETLATLMSVRLNKDIKIPQSAMPKKEVISLDFENAEKNALFILETRLYSEKQKNSL